VVLLPKPNKPLHNVNRVLLCVSANMILCFAEMYNANISSGDWVAKIHIKTSEERGLQHNSTPTFQSFSSTWIFRRLMLKKHLNPASELILGT